jgi:hypothetical protein
VKFALRKSGREARRMEADAVDDIVDGGDSRSGGDRRD